MGTVTTVRFDEELLKKADELAKIEHVDRSTILRKAAELADVPLWRFIDILKEREIGFKTSEEDLREMIEAYL